MGGRKTRRLSVAGRREVRWPCAIGQGTEREGSVLNEFTQVTGFHRKHAICVLNQQAGEPGMRR